MEVHLNDIGRRFNQEWIFRHLNFSFQSGNSYAILGPNGSGKSTLIQVLTGSLSPSEGKIDYKLEGKSVDPEDIYKHLCISAPYLELIEEFTLEEVIRFHFRLKRIYPSLDIGDISELLQLPGAVDKEIRYFSSGMKQRLKLVLTFCSDCPFLLLDEPTSNLDAQGIEWFLSLVDRFLHDRLLIIGSNQAHEHSFCDKRIWVPDFKP